LTGGLNMNDVRVTGDAEILTRSRNANIRNSTISGESSAQTRSGTLNLSGTEAASYELETRSGNLNASDLPGTPVTAIARSGGWNIAERHGLVVTSGDRNRMSASVGRGGPPLRVQTQSGRSDLQ
jgi:hypothetical protein